MSDNEVGFSFAMACTHCGHAILAIPDNPTDESRIFCEGCGADICSYVDLQAMMWEHAEVAAGEYLQKSIHEVEDGNWGVILNLK
jgi:hypothetical protein